MLALLIALVGLHLGTGPAVPEPEPADVILFNGQIWTADPDRPEAGWLAAADGKIIAMGNGDEWQAHAQEGTTFIDADGRRVLPGLIDSHAHLTNAANDLRTLDLRTAATRQQLLDMLEEYAATLPDSAWLVGTRWSSESWPDQRPPTADEINDAVDGRPTILVRMDGHSLLASRSALQRAGITTEGPADPAGGSIGRDEDGQPTGAIYEQAMDLINSFIEQPEVDEEALLLRAMAEANRNGITALGALESLSDVRSLARLDEAGKLTLHMGIYITGVDDGLEPWRSALELVKSNPCPTDHIRLLGFKGYMDGSLGSRTAWMTEPYADNDMAVDKAVDNAGFPLAMAESGELEQLIKEAAEMGLQPAVHAIGDRANHVVLNWYASLSDEQRQTLRPRVEHVQHLLPEDIKRFGQLGVIASMQPYHKADDGRYAEQRLGPDRILSSYAFRDLLDSGATLAFGSDWPVVTVNPFVGIHAAVTAGTLDGKTFVPEQSISVEEALIAYTRGAAMSIHAEDEIGMLKEDMAADFIILDQDVLSVPFAEISKIQVKMTVLGGKVVFERDS